MAGTQLTGLASGLDWSSTIDALMQAASAPQQALQAKQQKVQNQSAAVTQLQSLLSALQTSQQNLQSDGVFNQRAVAPVDSTSTWGSTADAGAAVGSYKVAVTQLATAAKLTGASGAAQGLTTDPSSAVISSLRLATPVTAGSFTVNGNQITVATTDTLGDVLDRIGTATGGAVTASYDSSSDTLQLTSSSGNVQIGSAGDTSNFLSAFKLFNNGTSSVSSASALGTVKLNVPIAQSGLTQAIGNVDANGNGTFTINGVSINYNVNTNTLQDVMNQVNESKAGVTMSYQGNRNQFSLTNNTTGDVGLFAQESSSNGLLNAIGLGSSATAQNGTNTLFSVNDGPQETSTSATLDSATLGVTGLNVTPTTTGTQTFNVSASLTGATAALNDFVSKFNAVESFIDTNTKVTVTGTTVSTGTLYGDNAVTELGRSLRSMIFQSSGNATGSITRLADLGLDFNGTTNTLVVKDQAALSTALKSAQISDLFSDDPTSSVSQFGALLNRTIGTNGSLVADQKSLSQKTATYTSEIADMQRSLDAQKAALTNEFVAMENAESTAKSQQTSLSQQFGSSS